jgi:hypothetical protein
MFIIQLPFHLVYETERPTTRITGGYRRPMDAMVMPLDIYFLSGMDEE